MIIFPAIDIKDNKCVRLTQGDFDAYNINASPRFVLRGNKKADTFD